MEGKPVSATETIITIFANECSVGNVLTRFICFRIQDGKGAIVIDIESLSTVRVLIPMSNKMSLL